MSDSLSSPLLHYKLSPSVLRSPVTSQSHLQFAFLTPLAQTFPGILPQMVIPENIAPNEDKLVSTDKPLDCAGKYSGNETPQCSDN